MNTLSHVTHGLYLPPLLLCSYSDGIACWVERRTRDRKVANLNPGRSSGRISFSRVTFVCAILLGVRSTPVLPQWHVKDPVHSAKSAGGRLHLNTHTPLTQRRRSGLTIYAVRSICGYFSGKRAHTQLVRDRSSAVVSAR